MKLATCLVAVFGAIGFAAPTALATGYTSSSYVQRDHLVAQWDAIDNVGEGTHDPKNATVWKNLAGTGSEYDMTLTGSARWKDGNSLVVTNCSAYGTKAAPLVKTIEVVFKTDYVYGRIMFNLGNGRQMVVFDNNKAESDEVVSMHGYFYAIKLSHRYVEWFPDAKALRYMAGTFSDVYDTARVVYGDGVLRTDGTRSNNWGNGDGVIMVGDRAKSGSGYGWRGEVQAIRLYDCELTAEEIAQNHAIDVARFGEQKASSADYVQDGLVVQWDGIDNAGTGVHNPNAAVWKNLASANGAYDLTLTNSASWNAEGRALVVNGVSAVADGVTPEYKTIEVVCKRTSSSGRMMFHSGLNTRFVIFDADSGNQRAYFSGDTKDDHSVTTKYIYQPYYSSEINFIAGRYDDNGKVTDVFKDANQREDGARGNSWGTGTGITIGGRLNTSNPYLWYGEVYAIRLYNRRLTKAELARNHRIDCKRFLTSSSYIQEGLTAHWDGIDNVGRGQHDSTAKTWKNLVSGGLDLTLGTGIWTDESLMSIGKSDLAATGTTYQAFNSIEVVFANAKHNTSSIMFNTGLANRYFALGGQFCMFKNYYAATNTVNRYSKGRYSASGVVSTGNDAIYINGANAMSGTHGDQWGVVDAYVQIGGRTGANNAYAYNGDIFAIRTYSNTLNANKVSYNYKVDRRRFGLDAKTFTWDADAGDGIFTNANWIAWKQATASVPGASDVVVLPDGDFTVALAGDTVVESLSVGAGAKLKMVLPSGADATDAAMLTVLGGATAASGAGIVLDAQSFARKHAEESISLVECETASEDALLALADNITFVNTDSHRQGTVEVVDGKRLVYTAPQKSGVAILIR